ncbi:hypothetical protein KGM_210631 [Danaus plexippus plexippus]|uniref:Uncharacterized protein n=1 Tax=Danaus plexippus plexippus TaxID=278856 RepID=A0A212EQD6_DANPL|nr:hypothetical protein KGM_210631 [Danaus plexippus plexippus]
MYLVLYAAESRSASPDVGLLALTVDGDVIAGGGPLRGDDVTVQ